MAREKTRREFLQDASLAGVAFVAGAAALSAEGCEAGDRFEFGDERKKGEKEVYGVLEIKDPVLAKQMYEQLEKNGELTGVYYDEDPVKKTKKIDTLGSPNSRKHMSAMTSADSLGTAAPADSTESSRSLDVIAGITVKFTVDDPQAAGSKVIVNSLCGCR